ncbi:hypothetical protein EV1_001546 [Malus domestica]
MSEFFKNVFSTNDRGSSTVTPSSSVAASRFELKKLAKEYDIGLDALLIVLGYLYSRKLRSLPKGVCVCVDNACTHVACRSLVDFMVEVLLNYIHQSVVINSSFIDPDGGALVDLVVPESQRAAKALEAEALPKIGFLAKHGYHVVAPDMRGYDDTDALLNPTSYSILHLVDDLVGLLDHFGGHQAFVVGHDHGALGKEKGENWPKKKQKQKAKLLSTTKEDAHSII